MTKQIPVFGMLAVLFVMIFSFPSSSAQKHINHGSTYFAATLINAVSGCLQTEPHAEVVLKPAHVIFDFSTITNSESALKKSENIFLTVNTFIRNPYYITATVHAP